MSDFAITSTTPADAAPLTAPQLAVGAHPEPLAQQSAQPQTQQQAPSLTSRAFGDRASLTPDDEEHLCEWLVACEFSGDDVNEFNEEGQRPLYRAIINRDLDAIIWLIRAGADINCVLAENELTALHVAVWAKNLKAVEWLLKNGAELSKAAKDESTPFHYLDDESPLAMWTLLKEYDKEKVAFKLNEDGLSPLAVMIGKDQRVAALHFALHYGTRIPLFSINAGLPQRVFMREGDAQRLNHLERLRAEIRQRGEQIRWTHGYIAGGCSSQVDYFWKRHIQPVRMPETSTLKCFLEIACSIKNPDDRALFETAYSLKWHVWMDGKGFLDEGSERSRSSDESLKKLPPFDFVNEAHKETGLPPLHCAVLESDPLIVDGMQHVAIAEWLIANGADVNCADPQKRTPLHTAVARNCQSMLELLIDSDADIHIADRDGRIPLHYLSEESSLAMMHWLLSEDCEKSLRSLDNQGLSPLGRLLAQIADNPKYKVVAARLLLLVPKYNVILNILEQSDPSGESDQPIRNSGIRQSDRNELSSLSKLVYFFRAEKNYKLLEMQRATGVTIDPLEMKPFHQELLNSLLERKLITADDHRLLFDVLELTQEQEAMVQEPEAAQVEEPEESPGTPSPKRRRIN